MTEVSSELRREIAGVAIAAAKAIVALGARDVDIEPKLFESVRGFRVEVLYSSIDGLLVLKVGESVQTLDPTRLGDVARLGTNAFLEFATYLVQLREDILRLDREAKQKIPGLLASLQAKLQ